MANEATLKLLLLGEDRSAGKTLRGVGKDAETTREKFGRLASASGKVLAGGLLAGGAAMVKFGNQASDLGETQSKVAQIFGKESVGALDSFADAAARNLGQSKQQALDAAATFGIIGKSAGKSGEDLVEFSTEMTALAGDLASFNNSTPEEAIEAIGSAMRGEAEPIRKYGVLLDDATLRNEALQLGLIKSVKEGLTPQQKALAAQAAILKQTKDAQGDFARTSDGLANKNRILKAEFANLTTEIGTKALPAMLAVTTAGMSAISWAEGNKTVVVALVAAFVGLTTVVVLVNAALKVHAAALVVATAAKKIHVFWTNAERVAKMKSTAQMVLNTAALLAAAAASKIVAVGLKVMVAAQWLLNAAMSANPIGLVIAALVALGIGMVALWKKSETFRTIVKGALKGVGDAGKWLWDNALRPAFAAIVRVWTTVVGALINGAAKAFGWVPGIGGKLKTAADEFNKFADKANAALDGIDDETVNVNVRLNQTKGVLTPLAQGQSLLLSGASAVGGRVNTSGWRLFGEHGPEIGYVPAGTQVYSATQTDRLRAGATSDGRTVVIENHFGVGTDRRAAAREIVGMLKELGVTTGAPVTV